MENDKHKVEFMGGERPHSGRGCYIPTHNL